MTAAADDDDDDDDKDNDADDPTNAWRWWSAYLGKERFR